MAIEAKNDLWDPPPPRTFRIYRCLRAERWVSDGRIHDECQDIIDRNPNIKFTPGLQDVEVDHLIHADTLWDMDADYFPRQYLDGHEGRLGNILASIEYSILVENRAFDAPLFYRTEQHRYAMDQRKNWWTSGRTAIAKVRIEAVRAVTPVKD
ncbi:MAG: hypothetical protein AAB383_06085 [Patescibacteria group bacterium]